jgi:hypothetical protein
MEDVKGHLLHHFVSKDKPNRLINDCNHQSGFSF